MSYQRTCRECGRDFIADSAPTRICSDECRETRAALNYTRNKPKWAEYHARRAEKRQPKQLVATLRSCVECGADFLSTSPTAAICGTECSIARRNKKQREALERIKQDPARLAAYKEVKRAARKNEDPTKKRDRRMRRRARQDGVFSPSGAHGSLEVAASAHKCSQCGKRAEHWDHIIPICIGGPHIRENLRALCAACNCGRPNDGSDVSLIDAQIVLDALEGVPTDHRHQAWEVSATACRRILNGDPPQLVDVTTGKRPAQYIRSCSACESVFATENKTRKTCGSACQAARHRARKDAYKTSPQGRERQRAANEKWKRENREKYRECKRRDYEKLKAKKELTHA